MKNKLREFKFTFDGRRYTIKNYTVCDTVFSRARGLMFRQKGYNIPLLFPFGKDGIYPIHSFFCRDFIGVWLRKNKIVDIKLVRPWKVSVTGQGKFDELLEIPLNSDDARKI